jgi:hypothetical protein
VARSRSNLQLGCLRKQHRLQSGFEKLRNGKQLEPDYTLLQLTIRTGWSNLQFRSPRCKKLVFHIQFCDRTGANKCICPTASSLTCPKQGGAICSMFGVGGALTVINTRFTSNSAGKVSVCFHSTQPNHTIVLLSLLCDFPNMN